jgi:hypothetical protein
MPSLHQNWRKRQNRLCLEVRGSGEERKRRETVRRNGPNNVCNMNK